MLRTCKLCGREADLRLSHIFPRFAVKWLKETSATGFLRSLTSRKRQQEVKREYLLCENCEQLLSRDEKLFRETIFIPYHEGKQTVFEYGPWLNRFLVGFHWRVLVARDPGPYPAWANAVYDETTEHWKQYLIGATGNAGRAEFHIFFADVIKNSTGPLPDKINLYFARGFDATPTFNEAGAAGVYAKLIKIMSFAFLTPRDPEKEKWVGTQVNDKGVLRVPQRIETVSVGGFLEERARLVESASSTLTPRQFRKLLERAETEPEVVFGSDSYRTHLADLELRRKMLEAGFAAVMSGRDRNKPCPCGSGIKFKKCCGQA